MYTGNVELTFSKPPDVSSPEIDANINMRDWYRAETSLCRQPLGLTQKIGLVVDGISQVASVSTRNFGWID